MENPVKPRETVFGCFLLRCRFSFSIDLSFFRRERCMCVRGGRRVKPNFKIEHQKEAREGQRTRGSLAGRKASMCSIQ